jgi:hypothetical protein
MFFRVSDQGFIGETDACLRVVLGVSCEECFLDKKVLCVIFGVCDLMRLL